jgi:L-serine deaminase
MPDANLSSKLNWLIALLAANLLAMCAVVLALVFGLLPKVERAVRTTERVEARFQAFADEVQPVVTAGAGKAVETIRKMDADKLSETATKKADSLMESAAERAKRFLERDKTAPPQPK